jgi:hypothetical protein
MNFQPQAFRALAVGDKFGFGEWSGHSSATFVNCFNLDGRLDKVS